MKTPEQMAEERCGNFSYNDIQWLVAYEAWLDGYQTAMDSLEKPDSSDGPDLQGQVESLQQYMDVAQRKIMGLEGQVESLRCDLRVLVSVIELMRKGL